MTDIDAVDKAAKSAFREGWAFAFRQWQQTGSVPDPDYRPKEEIDHGVWVDVDPESLARAALGAKP